MNFLKSRRTYSHLGRLSLYTKWNTNNKTENRTLWKKLNFISKLNWNELNRNSQSNFCGHIRNGFVWWSISIEKLWNTNQKRLWPSFPGSSHLSSKRFQSKLCRTVIQTDWFWLTPSTHPIFVVECRTCQLTDSHPSVCPNNYHSNELLKKLSNDFKNLFHFRNKCWGYAYVPAKIASNGCKIESQLDLMI